MAAECSRTEAETRARLLDVLSYDVLLDFTTEPDLVRSRSEICFRCSEEGASTFAQLSAAAVREITLNGIALDRDRAATGGRVLLGDLAATNVLVVEAEHAYSSDGRGLSRFTDPSDGGQYVLGFAYPTFASSLFCCFDQPDLPADVTLSVVAAAGSECVSHGTVLERPGPGEAGTWRFATVQAMKPQELSLCAGPYVAVEERSVDRPGGPLTIRLSCRASLARTCDLHRAGELAGKAVAFYEELFGVACPYPKLDLVFVPDLPPLAMLVPGLMGLSETLVHRMADREDDFVTMVVAHEIAHLFFGCLVEGRWWDDLWLAEALATWASFAAGDEALEMRSAWAQFAATEKERAYLADSLPTTQPVSSRVDTAAEAQSRPSAITYCKGASVVRQLEALIGAPALRAGMRSYLSEFSGRNATVDDIIRCWSEASGRDLTGWAEEWLLTAGVNVLRPEIVAEADGTIRSFDVLQGTPVVASSALRTHRIGIGVYDLGEDGRLRQRCRLGLEIRGSRTPVSALLGEPTPDVVVLNADDATFARVRYDEASWRSLAARVLDLDDPLAEAVCWNAAWDMVSSCELTAREFVRLVSRRLETGRPLVGLDELVSHALSAAGYYAAASDRSPLRAVLAVACMAGLDKMPAGGRDRRRLAVALASCAEDQGQLAILRSWLDGAPAADGPVLSHEIADLDLRRQVLFTLAAHDLVTEGDLDAFAAADSVGGETTRATCHSLRCDPESKERAWHGALAAESVPRMAAAHAEGFWVPGQETTALPWRDRYFTDALPVLNALSVRTVQRVGALLYPSTIVERSTVSATDEALERRALSEAVRAVLIEQRAILLRMIAARELAPS
ncbi:MAG: aminopeptidase N [Acidimicrobiales bacterium]